jgi:hypothetical protein
MALELQKTKSKERELPPSIVILSNSFTLWLNPEMGDGGKLFDL